MAHGVETGQVEQFLVVVWDLPDHLAMLTRSERAVAELIAGGATNEDIARARGRSVRTVANQVAAILRKLGVSSRAGVAAAVPRRSR